VAAHQGAQHIGLCRPCRHRIHCERNIDIGLPVRLRLRMHVEFLKKPEPDRPDIDQRIIARPVPTRVPQAAELLHQPADRSDKGMIFRRQFRRYLAERAAIVHPVQMAEQVGCYPQGLKHDNTDFLKDPHHIAMQAI